MSIIQSMHLAIMTALHKVRPTVSKTDCACILQAWGTPLHFAAMTGRPRMVMALLRAKANIEIQNQV